MAVIERVFIFSLSGGLHLMRIGVFSDMGMHADWLWSQCDGAAGRDESAGIELAFQERAAERVFCFNLPFFPKGAGAMPGWRRALSKVRGGQRGYRAEKCRVAFEMLEAAREKTGMLLYEPPPIAQNFYGPAKEFCARVWAPDDRAPVHVEPTVLPAFWMIPEDVRTLRALGPGAARERPIALAGVISGKTALPGHEERLAFLRLLRRAGAPLELFGGGLPADVGGRGAVVSKSAVLRAARLTLAIENYAEGALYVTEKLWDPLLCWSLPLYYGPRAADGLVPGDAFIRVPSLDARGVEVVMEAVRDEGLWEKRLGAIAEARRRCLEELRLMVWLRERLEGWR
ncbi:hypothetical protein BH11PLA1_BH11PLA1_14580 [soil metagenome]